MRLIFDIETDGLLDDLTTIHSLVIRDYDTGEVWSCHDHSPEGPSIKDGLSLLEKADLVIGHNIIGFDLPALMKVFPSFQCPKNIFDTLVCTRLMFADIENTDWAMVRRGFPEKLVGSHSLKAWGMRLGVLKGELTGGEEKWDRWTPDMQAYCEQDVKVTTALFDLLLKQRYSEEAIRLEHNFALLIAMQERHGFKFNEAKAAKLYADMARTRGEITRELQAMFPPRQVETKTPAYYSFNGRRFATKAAAMVAAREYAKRTNTTIRSAAALIERGPNRVTEVPFNPASRDQIAERLSELGWSTEKRTPTGKPVVDETTLEGFDHPAAKLIQRYLLLEKRIGYLAEGDQALLKCVRNGRIHGRVNSCGAVTGRCTHYNPNVAQVPKVKVGKDKKPLRGEEGDWGYEFRELFEPDDGHVLVGCDASGLELRCFAHYVAPYDGGEYVKAVTEGDVHTTNQQAAGIDTRDNAKTFIYAFLYGAWFLKLGTITGYTPEEAKQFKADKKAYKAMVGVLKRGRKPTDERTVLTAMKGQLLHDRFLERLPAIKQLKEAIDRVVKQRGYLRGLDGRRLRVRKKHAALNTLLQSAGALIMKQALVILFNRLTGLGYRFGPDYAFVANIHDEFQITARPDIAEQVGRLARESIIEAGKQFNFLCPLDGEYRVGANWAETH